MWWCALGGHGNVVVFIRWSWQCGGVHSHGNVLCSHGNVVCIM